MCFMCVVGILCSYVLFTRYLICMHQYAEFLMNRLINACGPFKLRDTLAYVTDGPKNMTAGIK